MIKYSVRENDWIKTTTKKYIDVKYHVKLMCIPNIICEANVILTAYTIPIEALNITETGNFIIKPNFYETFNNEGIFYERIYQTITHVSSNRKILVTKYRCQINNMLS